MAVVQFAGDPADNDNGNGHDGNNNNNNNTHLQPPGSEISKPTKRQRWATQRKNNSGGLKKRVSIVDRFHRRAMSKEEKRKSAASSADGNNAAAASGDDAQQEEQQPPRHIYFNIPLPDSERDEEGNIKTHYPRNKIRTAKFTALTFIPKDLWLQFHNIANIYFLFIIVLGVRTSLDSSSSGLT